ncbi:MAG: phosphatase PAP2 family protein [Gemmatimonadetes bacterium]|nr:phosphatase PAP2 family protein [Gemmatimonadota bacterium]
MTERVRAGALWVWGHVRSFHARAGVVLTGGLVLALAALWALSALTEGVLEGDTARIDRAVLLWLNSRATPWLDVTAVEITALADTLVVVLLAAVAAAILSVVGRSAYAWLLAASVGGGSILTFVLKAVFDRPRPQVFEWRAHYETTTAAYPSGHSTMSMVTLVTIAFIIHRLSKRRRVGVIAASVAAAIVLLIGLSRMYLGVHYPSDVLAGYMIGFAWAVFCMLVIEVILAGRFDRTTDDDDDDSVASGNMMQEER